MKDRINRITTQVRLNLKEVSTERITNPEIYEKASYIQAEIMKETKCVETDFQIKTVIGQESYDFAIEDVSMIKSLETSWGGQLTYKLNSVWETLSTTGDSYPSFFTIFNKKIKLRPNPLLADETITVWAYQEKPLIKMDDDIEPEIPEYADRCLIYGICAEYAPERFYEQYIAARSRVGVHAHNKIGVSKSPEMNW